jgi:uncharacterized membrane protein
MLHCEIMKKKTYYSCLAVILVALVVGLGFGIGTGNLVIPVIIVACAVGAIWLCHSRVTDVMTDDLESAISGKAALRALEVTVIIAAIGFAVGMGFFFSGGWGNGMHGFSNGSVQVHVSQMSPDHQMIYSETCLIADPANLTMNDVLALDRMSEHSHRVRDFPLAFGVGLGSVVVLLVGFYAAFSYYYTRKYEE